MDFRHYLELTYAQMRLRRRLRLVTSETWERYRAEWILRNGPDVEMSDARLGATASDVKKNGRPFARRG